jgi:putative membrane protein
MKWRESPLIAIKGFCMGMADLVPGVSGGTMAFILGIYERLLAAIRSFDKRWLIALVSLDVKTALRRPHWLFLLPLLAGILGALVFFTRVISIPAMLTTHTEQIYGLFFGLILASIIVLLKEVGRLGIMDGIVLLLGTAAGLLLVTQVPFSTPETPWFVFFAGMIAISAMILPGISGSFILLLMRKYAYIMTAVGRFDFSVILPFALGCIAGLALFSRLLSWLLEHYYKNTLLIIKGILIASLWVLWPFQQREYALIAGKQRLIASRPEAPTQLDETALLSFSLMVVGLVTVLAINAIASNSRGK